MYSLSDYQFWVACMGFILATFVSFYLPGFLLFCRIKKISILTILLSITVGYVLWAMQGYVFGYLHLRWLTYVYLLVVIVLAFPHRKAICNSFIYVWQSILRNKLIAGFVIFGVVLQSQVMFGSGLVTPQGMHFHGVNNVDGIMHLGYIQKMMTLFPPNEPGAYFLSLKNYHYWMDLSVAELARVWYLPAHHIFFQFLPLLFSTVTSAAVYVLMLLWTKSKLAGFWALFFFIFAGDATYLFMLVLHQKFGFYTPVIDNGVTQFYNMPHAAAKMIFMTGLISFYLWIKTKINAWGFVTIVLFSSLVGFKIYFGLFAGLGLISVLVGKIICNFVKNKKQKSLQIRVKAAFVSERISIILIIMFAAIAAGIFIPPNSGAGGLEYYPLEWPKLFLGFQNLDMREWWLRMQVYEQAENIRNIIILNTFAIIVGLICIHGTRVIGFLPHKNLVKLLGWEHMLFFIPGIIIFHVLGLTTLQKAGSFNVYNFFVVSTVIMALFSAYLLYELTKKKKWWAYTIIIVLVVLTIPRSVYEIYTAAYANITNTASLLPLGELKALQYLRENTANNTIVQAHPKNKLDNLSPYVAYFSGRDSYAAGIDVISAHNQPIKPNKEQLDVIFALQSEKAFADALKKRSISYIYLQNTPEQKLSFMYNAQYIVKVYEKDDITVYKVK